MNKGQNHSSLKIGKDSGVEGAFQNNTVNGNVFISPSSNLSKQSERFDYDEKQLNELFDRYLKNASIRYNHVKTLATGNTPRNIRGGIYVDIDLQYHGLKKVDEDNDDGEKYEYVYIKIKPEEMIEESNSKSISDNNYFLITGTAGSGKTMLLRNLFLKTSISKKYIPVFLRLNKISEQPIDDISVFDLIYSAMDEFDVQLPKEIFEHSLRNGKYLFLLDGFDEIIAEKSRKAAEVIQSFCSKYPDNKYIITSRPTENFTPLETFTKFEIQPFNKEQAVDFIYKIGENDEKTYVFIRLLEDDEFYKSYRGFIENPLLLSILFLTFRRNNSLPNRMASFYDKAFEALYNLHDSADKGAFNRIFLSSLDENQFKSVFAHFCFRSYMAEKYIFGKDEIISLLEKSLYKCNAKRTQAKNYLYDLETAVCLLEKEGTDYVFAHRSFQSYFAALYTGKLDDGKQKQLFNNLLKSESFWYKKDYYEFLIQCLDERFAINALEDRLRSLELHNSITDGFIIKLIKDGNLNIEKSEFGIRISFSENIFENYFCLFEDYKNTGLYKDYQTFSSQEIEERFNEFLVNNNVSDIEKSDRLTDEEKREFYLLIIKESKLDKFLLEIYNWLKSLDEKREKLNKSVNNDLLAMIEDL